MRYVKEAREMIAICRKLEACGYFLGTWGNVSMRVDRGILLTPSRVEYSTMQPWDLVVIDKDGKYYLIFASNNIQKDEEPGGLEIAVSDDPKGPFRGYLGKPLLDHFVFGAQPIDAHLFKDDDGRIYLYFFS